MGGAFENQTGATIRVLGDGAVGTATLEVANGFTNSGTIELTSEAGTDAANINVLSGTFVNATNAQLNVLVGSGSAGRSLGAQLDNRGTLNAGANLGIIRNEGDHLNSGTITLSGGDITLNQSMGTTPSFTTTGTIDIGSGRTFTVSGGSFHYSAGAVGGAGTLNLSSTTANFTPNFNNAVTTLLLASTTLNGPGTVTNIMGKTLNPVSSIINAPLVNQGVLVFQGNSSLGGAFENQTGATLRVLGHGASGTATLDAANGFTNSGTIELTSEAGVDAANLNLSSGTLVNATGAQLNVLVGSGSGGRNLGAQLDNRGLLNVGADVSISKSSADHINSGMMNISDGNLTLTLSSSTRSFTNTGMINIASNRTFTVTGGRVHNIAPGILQGNGTFNVSGSSFTNAGNVNPGASPGRLAITGNYTQTNSGILNIEVAGTDAGTNFDLLAVSGTARLAGTLNVTLAEGFTTTNGTKLRFLTANNRLNQFSAFLYPSNRVQLQLSYLANAAELEVTIPPMALNPLNVTLLPGETQTFTVAFGMPPYTFSLATNNSGGTIEPSSGLYTAGSISNVFDTVQGTDSQNFTAAATVFVTPDAFRISGRVADASGVGLENATVRDLGPTALTTQTGPGGFYSFEQVPRGSNITLTVSKPGYSFSPDQSFPNLNTNQVANFTATVLLRSISGVVTNATGQGVGGVKVLILKNSTISVTNVFTGGTGHFAVTGLPADAAYKVIPSKQNSTFAPASQSVFLLEANAIANFRITTSFVISGRLTDGLGIGIAGATVRFQSPASRTADPVTSTSVSGDYKSPLLPPGTYAVVPSKPNFGFTPASNSVSIVNANVNNVNFTAFKPFISVSGRVTNSLGQRFAGMTLILTGGTNTMTSTTSDGSFAFNNLPGNLTYSLAPDRTNFVFQPSSFTFTGLDRTQSFCATPLLPLTGRIVALTRVDPRALLLMNADGTERVSPITRFFNLPKLSPDGRRIAFIDRVGEEFFNGLFVMNADGSGRTLLFGSNHYVYDPAWSPDSLRLSFSFVEDSTPSRLKLINAAGGQGPVTVVAKDPGIVNATWSPDGMQLLFIQGDGGNHVVIRDGGGLGSVRSIFRIATNGTGETFITIITNAVDINWSPNGTKVAYSGLAANEITRQVFIMNENGSGKQQLTSAGDQSRSPTWSPDGSMIAFMSDPDGTNKIYAMMADGTLQTPIADGINPSWGPAPSVPTPSGANVTVTNGATTVRFSNALTPGTTTVVPAPAASPGAIPPGYVRLAGADMNFEVSTTVRNSGPIMLCFTVTSITNPVTFDKIRILHEENGVLVDRTILPPASPPPNFATKTICASVTSLSPFFMAMVVEPALPSITGVVVDAVGNPIPDITFELAPDSLQAISDINGQFTFANLDEGTNYTILPLDGRYDFEPPLAFIENVTGTNALAFLALAKPGLTLTVTYDPAVAGGFILTWPVTAEEHALEVSDSLSSPNWISVLEPASVEGDNFVVSVPASGNQRFFRLRRQ